MYARKRLASARERAGCGLWTRDTRAVCTRGEAKRKRSEGGGRGHGHGHGHGHGSALRWWWRWVSVFGCPNSLRVGFRLGRRTFCLVARFDHW
jgi:hypothetical protein